VNASPHKLILASAGTGKTYQLSGRFLALLFRGVPPERILATTFTRKAAGEILDRVLKRLVEAAEDAQQLEGLNAQLADEGGAAVTREDCVRLLSELGRGLHRFRIRTLDAFFVQLAGVFALELGLPPEWRILEEDELRVLQRDALRDALYHAERTEVLELLRAMQKVGEKGATRSVERALLRTVDDCRDAYLDSGGPAWDRVHVPEPLGAERFETALAALEAMPLPLTGKGEPNKNWLNSRDKLLRQARAGEWEESLESGVFEAFASGKPKFSRVEITDQHRDVLEPLLEEAAHHLLAATKRQNFASFEWLARFERAFFGRKDAAGGLAFEDVPRAIAPAPSRGLDVNVLRGDDFDFHYRLDGKVDHLLLDEFQDTAPSQWRVLAPLAEEIIAEGDTGRSFFCVGDVKQSIYAWRSGEPRLLAGMGERYPALPEPTQLVENWRSSPVVLDAVDRVFSVIGGSPAFEKRAAQRSAAQSFQDSYATHVAARSLPGAVTLYQAPRAESGGASEQNALALAAERARRIAEQAPHATIAILLRRNNHVARTIDLLRRKKLRASGEGGNPLTDANAVLHALSALQLADHPGDSAAAFHVATSPLAAALGAGGLDAREKRARGRVSLALRARLARGGYGETLGELLPVVESLVERGAYGPWDAKRFRQLVDVGYAFDRREELRPSAFLDFVRETKVEDPSSTQVKVMTIHASKGLEFDAVILPELDLSMTLREPNVLRARPEPDDELAGVSVSKKHAVCALDPQGLGAMRDEEDERHVQEALCLFYVAMTRAKRRLDLIVQDKKPRTLSYANVLRSSLGTDRSGESGSGDEDLTVLWRHPDSADAWWPAPPTDVAPPPLPEPRLPRFRAPRQARDLRKKSPSAEEGGHAVEVSDLLRPKSGGGFTRGTLIHRWMQEVVWLDDFAVDDAELHALGERIERDRGARDEALAAFRAALERDEVRALLTRPESDVPEVWRERPFHEIVAEGAEEVLWTGSFDRVELVRDAGGEPVRACVIDYKADRVDLDGVDARVAFYAPQLRSYAAVLARMTGLAPDRIATKLVFLEPGLVRTL